MITRNEITHILQNSFIFVSFAKAHYFDY